MTDWPTPERAAKTIRREFHVPLKAQGIRGLARQGEIRSFVHTVDGHLRVNIEDLRRLARQDSHELHWDEDTSEGTDANQLGILGSSGTIAASNNLAGIRARRFGLERWAGRHLGWQCSAGKMRHWGGLMGLFSKDAQPGGLIVYNGLSEVVSGRPRC